MIQLIYCWDFDDDDKKIIIQLIETWVNDKRREKERKGSELVNKKVIDLPNYGLLKNTFRKEKGINIQ